MLFKAIATFSSNDPTPYVLHVHHTPSFLYSSQHHHDHILHSAGACFDAALPLDLQSSLDQHPCG